MKISYSRDPADFRALMNVVQKRLLLVAPDSGRTRLLRLMGIMFSALWLGSLLGIYRGGDPVPLSWVTYVVIFLVCSILSLLGLNKSRQSDLKNGLLRLHDLAIGRAEIELTEQGVAHRSENDETMIRWRTVSDVVQDPNYLYLFFGDLSSYQIPVTAFADVTQREAFVATVESQIARNRDAQPR